MPAMWPHFLGHTWSSRNTPAAPAASNSSTVRMALRALPPPVSPSTITAQPPTVRHTRWATSDISAWVRYPKSGRPRRVAEVA